MDCGGEGLGQWWIGCGTVVDRVWDSGGSGIGKWWIGCETVVDRVWSAVSGGWGIGRAFRSGNARPLKQA